MTETLTKLRTECNCCAAKIPPSPLPEAFCDNCRAAHAAKALPPKNEEQEAEGQCKAIPRKLPDGYGWENGNKVKTTRHESDAQSSDDVGALMESLRETGVVFPDEVAARQTIEESFDRRAYTRAAEVLGTIFDRLLTIAESCGDKRIARRAAEFHALLMSVGGEIHCIQTKQLGVPKSNFWRLVNDWRTKLFAEGSERK